LSDLSPSDQKIDVSCLTICLATGHPEPSYVWLDLSTNNTVKFAYVKLYLQILNYVHVLQLQQAVDALVAWANEWQLSISVNKCCVLNVSKLLIVLASVWTV